VSNVFEFAPFLPLQRNAFWTGSVQNLEAWSENRCWSVLKLPWRQLSRLPETFIYKTHYARTNGSFHIIGRVFRWDCRWVL